MARDQATVAANLRSVINEGTSVLERVSSTTKRLSLEGTATLIGSFGGLLAVSMAYGVTIAFPVVSLALAAPLALGLGITGGLLAFRGTSAAKLDREMDNRRRAANYLLEQIRLLPRSAPVEIKTGLYLQYHRVITRNDPPGAGAILLPAVNQDGNV